jgi:phage shock protein PspC (stress-responsive transcriptional regulator)
MLIQIICSTTVPALLLTVYFDMVYTKLVHIYILAALVLPNKYKPKFN